MPRIAILAAIFAIAAVSLSACGSDDDAAPPGGDGAAELAAGPLPAAVVAAAERNCRQMLRDVKQAGRAAGDSSYGSTLELATEGFAKPGMRLIERLAERQQALQADAQDDRYDAYVDLFDPLIVLGGQWIRAGEAEDLERSAELQELLTGLGLDQREAARKAGLQACDVDFLDAMVSAASG